MRRSLPLLLSAALVGIALTSFGCGDDSPTSTTKTGGTTPSTKIDPPAAAGGTGLDKALADEIAAALAKGRDFLLTQAEPNGGFTDRATEKMQANVSFTAMAVTALVSSMPATQVGKDEAIRKGLAFLVKFQQENGAIFDNPQWANYATSASIAALASAKIGEFRKAQSQAMAYLESSQIADEKNEGSFGGFPYKDDQTADGSNAFIAVTGLEAGGLAKDSVVRKRMEKFASRLQNRSESNPGEVVVKTGEGEERTVVTGRDGGAFYRAGESKAGMVKRSDGKWEFRSYGSMTYAVLKLMMFAGVPADDARVVALVGWISNHWTVDRNPGFENAEDPQSAGRQGYFYYLYTMARALAAYEKASGKPLEVRDADGRKHNWRAEIARALLAQQAEDGSWRNEVDRWMEGMRTLATSFAMQTLGVLNGRLD